MNYLDGNAAAVHFIDYNVIYLLQTLHEMAMHTSPRIGVI